MSRPLASGSMSQTPAATSPKTKQDLKNHDLFKRFENCDSPSAILAAFQADQFVNVLFAFSASLGEGVGLVFSPAKVVFAGAGVLLLVGGLVYSIV
ncbi:hypothetical protein EDB84DRAFT_1492197 [Lactarius hengduanensis]|nr:hypothetical protein EDB84DRAFT_1492197 [Lactarius hengduanensis]